DEPEEHQKIEGNVNRPDDYPGHGIRPAGNFVRRLFDLRQRRYSHYHRRNARQRTKTPPPKHESDNRCNHRRHRQPLARPRESGLIWRRRWRLPDRRIHRRPLIGRNPPARHRRLAWQPLRFLFRRFLVFGFAFGLANAGIPVWISWRSQLLDQWRPVVRAEAQPRFLKLPFTLRTVLHLISNEFQATKEVSDFDRGVLI